MQEPQSSFNGRCRAFGSRIVYQVLQLMVEGGAVLQGQMLKEGLAEDGVVALWDAFALV